MSIVKRLHVIACAVLAADFRHVANRLGVEVSFEFLPGGLHDSPKNLRRQLQRAIDRASAEQKGDMIAVGYGLCGMGAVGIHARHVPLVVPRVQDCIALFLGSDAAYREQFAKYPGTYYISRGWVEEKVNPATMRETPKTGDSTSGSPPGATPEGLIAEAHSEAEADAADANNADGGCGDCPSGPSCRGVDALIAKYGEEDAEAINHFMTSWQRNYQRAAFIDTGVPGKSERYERIARDMADAFGWRFERLEGSGDLLRQLLDQRRTRSSDSILVVPPHHVTAYDSVTRSFKAVPVWETDETGVAAAHTLVFDENEGDDDEAASRDDRAVRLGLGIDAGGTYTDVVLYDFADDTVFDKAKALTTRWDYAVGIEKALDQLDAASLERVDLVSLSTTLATNAIVEGRGQKVGLLIMPPYGLFDDDDIAHRPIAVLDGKLEIDGSEIAPIDPEQVRRIVGEMVEQHEVGAFAVAGYASHNNPAHELAVREIVREQTGLTVTCGQDVSELCNYRLRAQTAALNARIIPALEALIDRVGVVLERRRIAAPVMVVKSDGSLMSGNVARERPIETILSGPAASVAGARYLTQSTDAIVVDIGGTTTDTAALRDGRVRTCEEGARVGPWRTHVKALDMRTIGLGGDSVIAWEKRKLRVGPQRVAPIAWLAAEQPVGPALDFLDERLDDFDYSTRRMDLFAINGRDAIDGLDEHERAIANLLAERPHSLHELAQRLTGTPFGAVRVERLERMHRVQRCALTPTDLLHAGNRLALWDADAASRICSLFARLRNQPAEAFAAGALDAVVNLLTVELLKKQLRDDVDPDGVDDQPIAAAMVANLLAGGRSDGFRFKVELGQPVIGIGAPVEAFLPQAAERLGTKAIIPPHADVANAIGAITSSVFIHQQVRISPNSEGRFDVFGLPDAPTFTHFDEANRYAVEQLKAEVRRRALAGGTSAARVEVAIDDQVAALADGTRFFLGRKLEARLAGRPDVARLAT